MSCPFKKQKDVPDVPASLIKEYQKSIPQKIETLKKLSKELLEKGGVEQLEAFYKEVHKIAGSAGCYGYQKASDLCKKLQKELLDMKDAGISLKKEWLLTLEQKIREIEEVFRE